jgi:hypothetical protein
MTPERSSAYSRVLALLGDLGPAKLHAGEQAVVREAADALLFGEDDAREALDRVHDLAERLVDAERLIPETAGALVDAVEACGPPVAAASC